MDENPRFEVLPAGEMRRKYGLTTKNRPTIRLDPEKVPAALRHLIPLAEGFGVSDDLMRADLVRKTPPAEVNKLRCAVQEHDVLLDQWLAGSESAAQAVSVEYLAFTCMRMAADGC